MGYYAPVSMMNTGKKAEHYSREHFNYDVTMTSLDNAEFCKQFAK